MAVGADSTELEDEEATANVEHVDEVHTCAPNGMGVKTGHQLA